MRKTMQMSGLILLRGMWSSHSYKGLKRLLSFASRQATTTIWSRTVVEYKSIGYWNCPVKMTEGELKEREERGGFAVSLQQQRITRQDIKAMIRHTHTHTVASPLGFFLQTHWMIDYLFEWQNMKVNEINGCIWLAVLHFTSRLASKITLPSPP